MEISENGDGDVQIKGHKFCEMAPSWETGSVSFSKFHSYIVSKLEEERKVWRASQLIGKGNAFHLNIKDIDPKKINFNQKWVFHLLGHCISS